MSLRIALRVGTSSRARLVPHHNPCSPSLARLTTLAHDKYATTKIEEFASIFKKSSTKRDDILNHYPALASSVRWSIRNDPPSPIVSSPKPIYVDHLYSMLDTLASSAKSDDIAFMDRLLADMPEIFLMQPSPEVHQVIVRAFLKYNKVATALSWLKHMPEKHGSILPFLELYHIILESLKGRESTKFLWNIVRGMSANECKPSHETYAILICIIWHNTAESSPPSVLTFQTLIQEMHDEGLAVDQSIATLLYDQYASRQFLRTGREVRQMYLDSAGSLVTEEQTKAMLLYEELSEICVKFSPKNALVRFQELKADGAIGSPLILKALIWHSVDERDLALAEEATECKATNEHWALLISNAVRQKGILRGQSVYDASKAANVVPSADLIRPMVDILCQDSEVTSFLRALSLYDDLVASHIHLPNQNRHSGPDLALYQALVQGLSRVANEVPNAFSICSRLEADMSKWHIPASTVAGGLTVAKMSQAPSEDEAMEAYQEHKAHLDANGYFLVLEGYSKLTFGQRFYNPSLVNYFQIANEMKRTGFPSSMNRVFTTILTTINNSVQAFAPESTADVDLFESYKTSTRRIHDLITLEASLSPNAKLWNLIMEIYSKLECFGDAYRLWEQMALSGRFNHNTVTTIFEVCGRAASPHAMQQVWKRLKTSRFVMNNSNWTAYVIGCLRLRMYNQAAKAVCVDMSKPDLKLVRIVLIAASRKPDILQAIETRVQEYLPKEWSKIQEGGLESLGEDIEEW